MSSNASNDVDHEADDEQSDWPGYDAGGASFLGLTDDDEDDDDRDRMDTGGGSMANDWAPCIGGAPSGSFESLTSTARRAYLARMKRLADCVPGREIRAGSRRVRSRQRGFTIKSSSSEQVSRFLQDSGRSELRLTVLRPADRNKVAHLANLYSLSMRFEARPTLPASPDLSTLGASVEEEGSLVASPEVLKHFDRGGDDVNDDENDMVDPASPAGLVGRASDTKNSSSFLVLTKTGRTPRVDDRFLVPKAPTATKACKTTEVKRRRRVGPVGRSSSQDEGVAAAAQAVLVVGGGQADQCCSADSPMVQDPSDDPEGAAGSTSSSQGRPAEEEDDEDSPLPSPSSVVASSSKTATP